MKYAITATLIAVSAELVSSADSPRPRGVGPEFAKFYKSHDTFNCVTSPNIQISSSQVNDDYCDCPDGSDEPGTSACAYLSPLSPNIVLNRGIGENVTGVLPGYYCKNKGHRPAYVPFTHINDGVCDYELCCDGSDEWASVGGTKCEDRCKEIGKEWRKQDEQRQKSHGAALKKRKELVIEAARLKQETTDQIENISISIQALEINVANLEKEKLDIERRERSRMVSGSGSGGKASVLAGLAKARLEEVRSSLTAVRTQRDVARAKVTKLEQILTTFKEEYNPNFNDEGVKRAVKAWEDYIAGEPEEKFDSALEKNIDDHARGDDAINWEEFESGESETDVDVLYKFEEYLPSSVRDWIHQKLGDCRAFLEDNGILAAKSATATESKAVKDATERLNAARNDLDGQQRKKTSLTDDLSKDYGKDGVFRAMKDSCTSLDVGEYTYEICWMKEVQQKSKRGGATNRMGNFASFDTTTVSEDVKPDGKGLGSGERLVMKFENGAHCWNGPSRSTSVVLACAETDEIWRVVEEEKCVYRMEVGTPAVCDEVVANGGSSSMKDEL